MQFETTCPNEHVIRFPLELAGRTGHCPKCSARFTIPTLNEIRESLGEDMDEETDAAFLEVERKRKEKIKQRTIAKKAKMEEMMRLSSTSNEEKEKNQSDFPAFLETNSASQPDGKTSEKKESLFVSTDENPSEKDADSEDSHEDSGEMIQFMCPNGHILSAAAEQAGKAGICPECQAKFLVPDFDDEEEDEKLDKEITTPPLPQEEKFPLKLDLGLEPADKKESPSVSDSRKVTRSPSGSDAPKTFLYPGIAVKEDGQVDIGLEELSSQIPEALRMDPMAKVFWGLWNEFGKLRKMELHTADGKVYFPVEFHESKSLSPIGYFEVQEEKESVTVIIRWDNIVRILIRD